MLGRALPTPSASAERDCMPQVGKNGSTVTGSMLLVAIVAVSILLMLLRPRGIAEVWWVSAGAGVLLALHLIPLSLAAHAVREGLDVYLFLIGMMLLSGLAEREGVFDWVAARAVSGASRDGCISGVRLFTLIYLAGIAVTVLMSNDATVVVLTPAVLTAVRRARVQPLPYLYACAMIANAASFALPISNPANLVVFRGRMPTLGHWMVAFGLAAVLAIAATYVVLRWHFRRELNDCKPTGTASGMAAALPADGRLSANGRLVLLGLTGMIAALLVASQRGIELGWPTCGLAVAVTVLLSLKQRRSPIDLLLHISWKTIGLVAALFILVDAMVSVGALRVAVAALSHAETLHAGALLVSFAIGLGNNLVNNLPLGLIVGSAAQAAHLRTLMSAAVMMGIDLGSNLSVTGSLATILWLIALRREGLQVSARQYLRVGIRVMPAGMFAALAGLYAMHLVGAF